MSLVVHLPEDLSRRVEAVADHAVHVVIPTPAIVETSWLIADRLGPAAEVGFLRSVAAGQIQRVDLDDSDWRWAVAIVVSPRRESPVRGRHR